MIGKTLNHYQILDKLGEGGMATVYLAEDTRLSRKVALKVLPEDFAQDPDRIARFEREAKAIAALNHPNIVTIYSVEEADGVRFLTMELVDGKSLDELIPDGGMELDEFFDLALPLINAVAAAHRRGVTHRDIKPGNVMVSTEGVVKLLDLGLAKLDPSMTPGTTESSADTLTKEGRAIGTVPYMAPEQLAGRPLDHRVDIFALGVVLYEMLTGGRPFVGGSSAELISAIFRDTPKPVTEIKVSLPNGLGHSLRRCLEKLPEDRFQSAEDLRVALESVAQTSSATPADHPGKETVRLKAAPRKKVKTQWLIAVGIALAVAIVAGAVFSLLLREKRQAPVGSPAAADLTLVLLPIIETGRAEDPELAGRIGAELGSTLDAVGGLQVLEGSEQDRKLAAISGNYRLGSSIEWIGTDGASARIGFEMSRAADGALIWSESFEIEDMATPLAQSQLTATVRARIGHLLGLEVQEAPGMDLAAEPSQTSPAPRSIERPSSRTATVKAKAKTEAKATVVEPAPQRPAPSSTAPVEAGPVDIQLALSLTSTLAEGVVSIYADTVQIYRRPFSFTVRKEGVLGRVGLKKRVAGELADSMLVPNKTSKLRVYIALEQQPARQFLLTPDLRDDGTDLLVVDIRKKNVIDVHLE